MATCWWRNYADPTMAVLTSRSGPFARSDHSTALRTLRKRTNVHPHPRYSSLRFELKNNISDSALNGALR